MKGEDSFVEKLWKETVVEVEVTNGMGPMDNKYGWKMILSRDMKLYKTYF